MHRIGLGTFIAVLAVLAFFFSGASFATHEIVPGVHAGPADLGGLSWEQAAARLENLAGGLERTAVCIRYGNITRQFSAKELGVSLDNKTTLERAFQVGRTGSFFQQWRERQLVKRHGKKIQPAVTLDRSRLQKAVSRAVGDLLTEPVNAGFKIMPDDSVLIVPGRMGTKIDYAALSRKILRALSDFGGGRVEVELPVLAVPPQRTAEDIKSMGINGLLASYSTKFDPQQVGRTYNIKVAAAALDGLLIAPGDEFSFNRVVGPRSSEAGYKNANVIINNELVEGLGGGVCQVSSTLYNAVLLANLAVTERSNHSLPVGYVPIGLDATVVYGAIDFRFVNNKDCYLYTRTSVEGDTLTVKIYGDKESSPRVELASWVTEVIEPEVIFTEDPNLAAGEQVVKQEGTKGYKAAAVRYVWENGEKRTEKLPASYYHPVNRIVAVGTGEVKPSVVIPSDEDLQPAGFGQAGAANPGEAGAGEGAEAPSGAPEQGVPGGAADGEDLPGTGGEEAEPASPPEGEVLP